MVFIPTYLYIKQHTITGKLYFGKTTRKESKMLKYKGSGSHWKNHILKYGNEYVITLWFKLYDNIFDLVADALSMSKSFDIVNNVSWLNLIPEDGMNGGNNLNLHRRLHPMIGKKHSEETKQKQSINMTGPNSHLYGKRGKDCHMYGKVHSEETKQKQSKAQSGELNHNFGKFGKNSKNYGKGKLYDISSPDGNIIFKTTIRQFCDMFDLHYDSCLSNIKRKYGYKDCKILHDYSEISINQ